MTQFATVTAIRPTTPTIEQAIQDLVFLADNGQCRTSAEPEQWFDPQAEADPARAKSLCAGCPVRAECLDGALRRNEEHGIWGGTTPDQRNRLRRRMARRSRRAVA